MANAREFTTIWGFKIEHEKLDRVEQQLEGIKNRLEFLAAAEVAHKLFELTERFAKFAEELHLMATSAGETVEEFQKMSFAAGHAGVSQDELAMSLARVSKSLYAARNGSAEAQKAFADAGFSADQVNGLKNGHEALLLLADRLRGISDPVKRLALTQELLGRGSSRMVGFLAQGSAAIRAQGVEAEKLGVILSEHQVESLMKVEHALQNFWLLLKNIGATIASLVAPSLEFLVNDFLKFFQANRGIIELNFENWINGVAYSLGFLWGLLTSGIDLLISIAKYFHLEGHILPTIATVASFVLGIFAVSRAISIFGEVMAPAIALINLFRNSWIAAAAAEWIAEAPLLAIGAAIAIVVIAIDQLWAALTGNQSWLGQFVSWLSNLEAIQGILGKISGFLPKSVTSALGIGGQASGPPGSIASAAAAGGGNYEMNAPITVNVPEGTDPTAVGKQAREGVRDHLNRVLRETQRSTTSAVAY
jgi:hypothetical protein